MVTYLWIAFGGALGSVARAWIGLAILRITGPQFPWGTILINIVGSFIIGFFGTLTATNGRFGVPADARAFVMVGICGGFTTFSSFSLQTLDLARDGRMGQASANIGLSLVLCLAAVAAGHYAAAGINTSGARIRATGGPGMGAVVLTILDQPDAAPGLLAAAERLLEIGGGGHIEALVVRTPPVSTIMPTEEVLTADREAEIRAEQENWAGQLRTIVEGWLPRGNTRTTDLKWIDVEGDLAQVVAAHGKRAGAVIVASCPQQKSERAWQGLHAALFDTGNPVLIVPPDHSGSFGRVVAIAWRDDERAMKAVLASLPILQRADRLHILQADDGAEADAVLRAMFHEHGLHAQTHVVPANNGATGERLLAMARQAGADLLVMGAYSHGEWREAMFGGVTQYMLSHADLPVLMRH